MAQKRCFTPKIVESDAFLEMPLSTQCLYFHLNFSADDDGFVNSPKKVMRIIGCSEDDLKLLIAKSFVLVFENGVLVIKHYRMHNTLQNDRYKPTDYQEEFAQLGLKDNNSYTWKQNGNILETQHNITKHNLTKQINNIKHKYGQYNNVLLSDEELNKLKDEFTDWEERIERVSEYCASKGKSYRNYLATIRSWSKKEKAEKKEPIPTFTNKNNPTISNEKLAEALAKRGLNG